MIPRGAKLEIFGLPWHGKVADGTVYPPGDPSRAYPQVGGSNVLLESTKALPDRTGKPIDAANSYRWKARLLVQIGLGTSGTVPVTIEHDQWIYIDPTNTAWLMQASVTWSFKYHYSIKLSVVRRFGLIAETHEPDFNYQFFAGASVNLESYYNTHDLSAITGFNISQNPSGNRVVVVIYGYFGHPIGGSLGEIVGTVAAQVVELSISGNISSVDGTGAIAGYTLLKDVSACVNEQITEIPLQKYELVSNFQTVTACSGVPGVVTITETETEGTMVPLTDPQTYPLAPVIDVGEWSQTEVNNCIIGAFYNENGDLKYVERERTYKQTFEDIETHSYTLETVRTWTTEEGSPDPEVIIWRGVSTESTSEGTQFNRRIQSRTHETKLYIGGVEKEVFSVIEVQDSESTYSGSDSTSGGVPGDAYSTCYSNDTSTTVRGRDVRSFGGGDYDYSGYVLTNNITCRNNGSELYNGAHPTDYETVDDDSNTIDFHTDTRRITNRITGLAAAEIIQPLVGGSEWFGAHTDNAGIPGSVDLYASYDPYTQTLETDENPIGFV